MTERVCRVSPAHAEGRQDGMSMARRWSDGLDHRLRRVMSEVAQEQSVSEVALWGAMEPLAMGSYGRQDLAPHSDIDVMFLLEEPSPHWLPAALDRVLYALWDEGLELGHSVRSPSQALQAAESDHRVLSALLEHRRVRPKTLRHPALHHGLLDLLSTSDRVDGFIEAKLTEARDRRQRYGDTVFLLEPNIKESEGGLREFHLLTWVAWARWRTTSLSDLLKMGVVTDYEVRTLYRAYDFLLRVRFEMHEQAGRRQDALRFELQEAIAPILGFRPRPTAKDPTRAATERFMRAYYFHARQLALFCRTVTEERAVSRRRSVDSVRLAPGGFRLWHGQLSVSYRAQFIQDPAAILRLFRVAQEEALKIYDHSKNRVREALVRFDRHIRRRADVLREFFGFLEDPKGDGSLLFLMHDLGVFRALIPEFRRVTSRWQHSLYHVYTVDVHSLVVLRYLKRLRRGEFQSQVPELSRWMEDLVRPGVLYLAALLHDVGKGWEQGDHCERGERVARDVGARFEAAQLPEWTQAETEDLVWLVGKHLLMSDISQRRDISDLQLVKGFAAECQSVERLRMLYILTYADMRGTSPKVWSSWKHSLLGQLYLNTLEVLTSQRAPDLEAKLRSRRLALMGAIETEARSRPDLSLQMGEVEAFVDAMSSRYVLGFSPRRMLRHVQMWKDVSRLGGLAVHVAHLRREGTTRYSVMCPDRPGLLSLLAGCLAAHRLQILSAQVYSVRRGQHLTHEELLVGPDGSGTYDLVGPSVHRREENLALDVLHVVDQNGQACHEPTRWAAVRKDLEAVLFEGIDVASLVETKNPPSGLEARVRPAVPVEVRFDNRESETETVIDVFGPDQIGALYRIARVLADHHLSISMAKISTQGDRLADGFYVRDRLDQKVTDPVLQKELRRALIQALNDRPEPRKSVAQIV